MNEELIIEPTDILISAWAVMEVRLQNVQMQGPNGPVNVQQQVQVPIFFRSLKEVQDYVAEQYNVAQQMNLQHFQYAVSQLNDIEFYYKEGE